MSRAAATRSSGGGLRLGRGLLDQGEEKTVRGARKTGRQRRFLIVGQRQELAGGRRAGGKGGIACSLQKSVDLRRTFVPEHGTRDVEHAPARRQQRPERVEEARLRRRQRRQVARP